MALQQHFLQSLSTDTTVVTATNRLARELVARYDRGQLEQGGGAWESPDILAWGAWLQRSWKTVSARDATAPALLGGSQSRVLWQRVIDEDIRHAESDTRPLWNVAATAKSAEEAWRLLHAWRIDPDDDIDSFHPDHRRFRQWSQHYRRACEQRNWIDPAMLADWLRQRLGGSDTAWLSRSPEQACTRLVLAGFDRLTPQQQRLLDGLEDAGIDILHTDPGMEAVPPESGAVSLHCFDDDAGQWLAAARWARDRLESEPARRLAIITPDLGAHREAIEYALRQVFTPSRMLAPEQNQSLPWHCSLGAPLSQHPVAAALLDILAPLAGGKLTGEQVRRLLRSPFVAAADSEFAARNRLELWYRGRLPWQLGYATLLDRFSRDAEEVESWPGASCPRLIDALLGTRELLPLTTGVRSPGEQAQLMTAWLDRTGWPGERTLDSGEFQVVSACREQVRQLSTLDPVTAGMSAAEALSWLRRRFSEQPFQVRQDNAPVQVLGVLEAAGLAFDATWFGGLVENEWPFAIRMSPFLPPAAQKQAGIHEASHESNFQRCLQLQQQLMAGNREVVLSFPGFDGEVPLQPSPLLQQLSTRRNMTEVAAASRSPAPGNIADAAVPAVTINRAAPELELFHDDRGPVVEDPDPVRGGTALIANQAQCPFRAYAIHRLAARATEFPEAGLDHRQRGILVHQALQRVWQQLRNLDTLQSSSPQQLDDIIVDAVKQPLQRFRYASGCGDRFMAVQRAWLADTLRQWLAVDATRTTPFEVVACEQPAALTIGGLQLDFYIDRIDKLAGGGEVLIDYKTGDREKPADWVGERPASPQLPLYALARGADGNAEVDVVTFARVKAGACEYAGVSREAGFAEEGKVQDLENHRPLQDHYPDWEQMVASWRTAMSALAGDFMAGRADVDPVGPQACEYCDLAGLCRVNRQENDPGEAAQDARS